MNRPELVAFLQAKCDLIVATIKDKNHDYTGGSPNPFANFDAVEDLDVCSAEIGLLTRITDKFMRVRSFVKLGVLKVKAESVTDTLVDLAAYALLMAAKIESRRRKADQKAPIVQTGRYRFEVGKIGSEERVSLTATAEKRSDTDWVLLFDHSAIDAMRAPTLDGLLKDAITRFGPCHPLEEKS